MKQPNKQTNIKEHNKEQQEKSQLYFFRASYNPVESMGKLVRFRATIILRYKSDFETYIEFLIILKAKVLYLHLYLFALVFVFVFVFT